MTTTALHDWKKFYKEGEEFHKTLKGSLHRPEIFSPALVQNIAAMSIEKYFMAIFMSRGLLPHNHTMSDFIRESKPLFPIPEELEETLLYMDSLQRICSIEHYQITPPKPDDVSRFVAAADQVAILADALCEKVPAEES